MPFIKKIAVPLACVYFAVFSNAALADDAHASRYLYCANVVQFYYQYLLKHESKSEQVNMYRLTRDNFRLAAAASKTYTPQSLTADNDAALQKVIAVLEKERADGVDLMTIESKSCAETMVSEAVPLLKPKSGQQN